MHSIWAVATNTLKQALRMKVAAVFIILLLVLLPTMGVSMTGDGTLKGRLQTFVSYSLSLTSLLLCLFTIVVSIYSLTNDIKQRQIYTVITKPIRRFQLLFGKLLGIILLDAALLLLFSVIIYGITICMPILGNLVWVVGLLSGGLVVLFLGIIYTVTVHIRIFWKVLRIVLLSTAFLALSLLLIYVVATHTPQFSEVELAQVGNEFFTARTSLTPAEVDVTQEVLDTYDKLEKTGQLLPGSSRKEVIDLLTSRKQLEKRAAAPGHELVWEFSNVKLTDPNQSLFIRFNYDVSVNPPDLQVFSRWFVGDDRQLKYGADIQTPIYTFDRKDLIRTFHEIEVPADAVAPDGYLMVGFLNVPLNNTVVIFPPGDRLAVLYKADSFTANFLRAVLLILLRLIFLACLGILASTFLSFPVAILFCLAIFSTGTISGFCLESFDFLSENISGLYSYTIRPIILLLPQFDKFSPAKFLVPARLLSWSLLAKAAGFMLCVKAILLLLFALLIFSYREIAKVII